MRNRNRPIWNDAAVAMMAALLSVALLHGAEDSPEAEEKAAAARAVADDAPEPDAAASENAPSQAKSDEDAPSEPRKPLVRNGGFEEASEQGDRPAFWDLPDGLGVQWIDAAEDERGKVIRIDTRVSERDMVERWKAVGLDKWVFEKPAAGPVAATYGLSYYSDAFPVEKDRAYRVSFDFAGPSGGAKVWVRGYGMFRGEMRRRYETFVNCRAKRSGWTRFSQVFHPTKHRPEVSEMRVMLYAYWPPGEYRFDNVTVEPISDEEYEAGRRTR